MLAQEQPKATTSPAGTDTAPARAATGTVGIAASAAPVDAAPIVMAAANADAAVNRGDALAGILARCVERRGVDPTGTLVTGGRSRSETSDDALPAAKASPAPVSDAEVEAGGRVGGGGHVLQRNGTASRRASPPTDHRIVNVDGPTARQCGGFSWKVNFRLNRPSIAGGYFIQEIRVRRRATDCDGTTLPEHSIMQHYWEAWRVQPGAREDELVANGTYDYADLYQLDSPGLNTKGTARYSGNVAFYEGLTLPASFVANNPATLAHDLPSTAVDPHLPAGTVSHRHNISASWNCCPASSGAAATPSDTVLSRRRPA
jgi:hypothetical protein